jgi:hypothetical protein
MVVPRSSEWSIINITINTTFIATMGGIPLAAGPAGTTVIGAQSGVMVAMLPQQQTLGAGGIAAPITYTAVPAQPAGYAPAGAGAIPAAPAGYAAVPAQPMSLQQPPQAPAVELQMRTMGSSTPAGPSNMFGATSPAYTAVPQNVAGKGNTFKATVPPGARAGETFTVISPGGKMVSVAVPQGAYNGMEVTVAY